MVSVSISMHGTADEPTRAKANISGTSAWLEFRQGMQEITIFGDVEHIEKFRMAADILNDAFAAKPEPAPAATADPDDDGIPF